MKIIELIDKTAIFYKNNSISYFDLITNVKFISKKFNLPKNENMMIYMENRPEYIYSFLSIWNSKSTCVCIDASSTAEEMEYYIENSDVTTIFTSKENTDKINTALKNLNMQKNIIIVDEIDFSEKTKFKDLEENLYIEAPNPEDTALILYTSGTTGKPKGVMLSFDNILCNIEALNEHKMFDKNDIVIAVLPLHHILPLLGSAILPLINSGTVVFLQDLSSKSLIESMQKYKVTMLIGVPKLWELIHKKIMDTINSKKITKLIFKVAEKINSLKIRKKIFKKVSDNFGGNIKFFVSGGSKLDEKIARDFYTLGIKICEGYGMTETSPMISYTPQNDIVPGCAGKIIKGVTVKISSENEILVQGRNVMKGYYKNKKATDEIIDKDGWLHTGDLGKLEGQHLYITGRKKEMIVLANGKNINPIEIEEKIRELTNLISEIVVIEYNSVLTAVIKPDLEKVKDEKIANIYDTLKWEVIDSYNKKSIDYKKILDLKLVNEEFPKTKIGKIKRFLIKDLIEGNTSKREIKNEPNFEEYAKIKKYLSNLKNKEVYPDSHIEMDLALDSLDMVEFLHFIEMNFGLKEENIISNNPTLLQLAEHISKNKSSEKIADLNWKEILKKDITVDMPSSNILSIISKPILFLFFNFYARLSIKNKVKENSKAVLFVGNHQSFLDVFIFNYAMSSKILKNTYYLAKIVHFRKKIMKLLANCSNVILVDLNKDIAQVLQTLAKLLRENKNVLIFPEGVRTRDGRINEFKKSFAILAKELNVDVQPFVIKGAYDLFPTGKKIIKPGKISIEFLEKIQTENLSYEEIVAKTFEKIKEKL